MYHQRIRPLRRQRRCARNSPGLPRTPPELAAPSRIFLLSPMPRPPLTTPGLSSRLLGFSSKPPKLRSFDMPSAAGPTSLHGFGTNPARNFTALPPLLPLLSSSSLLPLSTLDHFNIPSTSPPRCLSPGFSLIPPAAHSYRTSRLPLSDRTRCEHSRHPLRTTLTTSGVCKVCKVCKCQPYLCYSFTPYTLICYPFQSLTTAASSLVAGCHLPRAPFRFLPSRP